MRNEQKIIELYNAGKSDADIAREVGMRSGNIFYWRKRHGLKSNRPSVFAVHELNKSAGIYIPKRTKPDRPLTPLEIAAIEARKNGMTYGQYMASRAQNGGGLKQIKKVENEEEKEDVQEAKFRSCQYNSGVQCDDRKNCIKCSWNPNRANDFI